MLSRLPLRRHRMHSVPRLTHNWLKKARKLLSRMLVKQLKKRWIRGQMRKPIPLKPIKRLKNSTQKVVPVKNLHAWRSIVNVIRVESFAPASASASTARTLRHRLSVEQLPVTSNTSKRCKLRETTSTMELDRQQSKDKGSNILRPMPLSLRSHLNSIPTWTVQINQALTPQIITTMPSVKASKQTMMLSKVLWLATTTKMMEITNTLKSRSYRSSSQS